MLHGVYKFGSAVVVFVVVFVVVDCRIGIKKNMEQRCGRAESSRWDSKNQDRQKIEGGKLTWMALSGFPLPVDWNG